MGTLEIARDVAVIFIALLDLVLLIALAVVAYFGLRGMLWLRSHANPLLDTARTGAAAAERKTDAGADAAAHWAIRVSAWLSGAEAFVRVLFGGRARG